MSKIIVGQRYMSIAEPELGLGIISKIQDKIVSLSYPAAAEVRQYGLQSAPLKRILFEVGDDLSSNQGQEILIKEIKQSDTGLLVYIGEGADETIFECDILDSISFHRPEEKLLNALPDKNSFFQLRIDTIKHKAWLATFRGRGFIGGRLSLIKHQFYLANKVTSRLHPRVLLADEVGLGKTIEAGLILHKLILTGRIERVLIITPNTLNYQWFIEMLRKYNLSFSVVNEQTNLEAGTNPFDENNLVITSMELLCGSKVAQDYVNTSKWDLMVVDEAHKLYWKETGPSVQYTVISELAAKIKGLLLLTATPEIYGREGHFSHLKLIDPDRFHDFGAYCKEDGTFQDIAKQGRELLEGGELDSSDEKLAKLIDLHGPGRVYFRNTREVIDKQHRFFPVRKMLDYPLENESFLNFEKEKSGDVFYQKKILWLIEFLEKNRNKKVLLICHSKEKVLKIEDDLKKMSVGNKVGVFHEDLSLMARDRQGAYFRDEDGSNILLCSEIGSEGRNFQFCQDLVLMDLPRSPDLLEQRIGRLDRIGQKSEIFLHVPYLKNTWEEVLFNWYHQVFESFTLCAKGATKIFDNFQNELQSALGSVEKVLSGELLTDLIQRGRKAFLEHNEELQAGRDVLIELNSFNRKEAEVLTDEIINVDESNILREYLDNIYNHFGIDVEDLDATSQFIKPNVNMYIPHFPFLPEEGFSYTFDRQLALEREELDFMSWDHPMVGGIMDLICGEEYGNIAVMVRKNGKVKHFIEVFYLLESVAPRNFEVGRFLPPTIIRVLLNLEGEDFSDKWSKEILDDKLEDAPKNVVMEVSKLSRQGLKGLIKKCKEIALTKQALIKEKSKTHTKDFYNTEIERLKELQKVNTTVSDKEVNALNEKRDLVIEYIDESSLGLDSIRFIY